jgi:hypothetical protein
MEYGTLVLVAVGLAESTEFCCRTNAYRNLPWIRLELWRGSTLSPMKRNTESAVRKRLRELAGERVRWVESAHGGTVGAPDAIVDCAGGPVELELKLWRWDRRALITKIRPVQRRYHLLAAMAGRRTGFMVGFDSPASEEELQLWRSALGLGAAACGMVVGVFPSRCMPVGSRNAVLCQTPRLVETFFDIEALAAEEWTEGAGCQR